MKSFCPNYSIRLCLAFSIIGLCLQAQEANLENANLGRFRTLEIRGHTGGHVYTGTSLVTELESGYGAVELRYAWQGNDKDHWSAQHGYPSYGIGFYSGFIGNPQVFGNPNALFGFVNFPVGKRNRRNKFSIEPAVGITYNLEPFDSETNPKNDAIGSRLAVYFNMRFGWAYKWTREMDITYGFDFTHFSNGRSTTPNYGLNMLGVNLGFRYHYNADQKFNSQSAENQNRLVSRFKRPKKENHFKIPKNQSINLYLATGTVQTDAGAGTDVRYPVYSIVLDYQHKFNSIHSVTAGFDYLYDGSLIEWYPEDSEKRNLSAFHVGYDFMFWKMTAQLHAAAYLNNEPVKGSFFLRPAVRYDFSKWGFAQVGLKTQEFVADWIEFGIGFRLARW